MDGLECVVLTEFAELEAISADWERLHEDSGRVEIFQHFRWVEAWWKALRHDNRLMTSVVRRGGQIVAILPLVVSDRRLRFLGHSVSDYNHLLARPDEGTAVLDVCLASLCEHREDWDEILLENVPDSSFLAECVQDLRTSWKGSIAIMRGDPCPTMVMANREEPVLEVAMGKLRRAVNRLKRRGSLRFRHLEDSAEAAAHLPRFFTQHIRRSAIAGRHSRFVDPDYVAFFHYLVARLSLSGEIRFSVLELDERPIAYHFGSLYGGKYLWYKPSFDVDLWELAPGQALLWHLFEYLRSADVAEFDFARGSESFKHRFANRVNQNLAIAISRSRGRFLARRTYVRMRDELKTWTGRSVVVERAANSARRMLQETLDSCRQVGLSGVLGELWRSAIWDRQESWLVFVDTSVRAKPGAEAISVEPTSLGGLADLVTRTPNQLNPVLFRKAREYLRTEKRAWIVWMDGSACAIMWTSVKRAVSNPIKPFPLPAESMLVEHVWSLASDGEELQLWKILRQLAVLMDVEGLPTWAVCPKSLLESESELRAVGIEPVLAWVGTGTLGRIHWQSRDFA